MKIFIDTSSLFKKYYIEAGSQKLFEMLRQATEIVVAHITYIEIQNTLKRIYFEKKFTKENYDILCKQINSDFPYFQETQWNDELKNICLTLINKYQLRSLDIIQLASAQYARPQVFITSDKRQYEIAKKELKRAVML